MAQTRSDSRAREAVKRAQKTFEKQQLRMTLNQELAELFYPERATFLGNSNIVGDEYYRTKYDGYPIFLRWRLGNALGAMTRGRGQEWFASKSAPEHLNKRDDVAAWNEDKSTTMRAMVYEERAQFGSQMSLSDQDYALFGNSCVKVTTNDDLAGLLWRTKHLSSVAAEENGEGQIDVTHEKLAPTGRVALKMFEQRGNLSRAMKNAATEDGSCRLDGIMLSVFPLSEYEPGKDRRPTKHHKWVALYCDIEEESVIQTEYFFSFPYIWRRWLQAMQGSPYAISPCAMVALADSHMAQDIRMTMIEAMQRAASPPVQVSAGALENDLDLSPDGVNFIRRNYDWRTGGPIAPLQTGTQPNWALEFSKDNREGIAQFWLINLLTLPQDREMTAYETERLIDQDAREASPIFEPMEGDNARMMKRADEVATHWGAFDQPPEILQKASTTYDFETPITAALRRVRAQQATQVISFVGQAGQLELQFEQTEAFRRVNWKEVITDGIRGIGPANWVQNADVADQAIQGDQQELGVRKAVDLAGQARALAAPEAMSAGKPVAALPAPQPVVAQPAG